MSLTFETRVAAAVTAQNPKLIRQEFSRVLGLPADAERQAREVERRAKEAEREAKESALAEVARLQALLRASRP